ncbi:MAG: hypothetical protein J6U10_01995 [Lachnospiraceae bacterium]|nr:hypothetical protein [Lachnospiraceae bacterium]
MVDLSGNWTVKNKDGSISSVSLPGTLNALGLGEVINRDTPWNSGLFNPFWYEREEYQSGTGEDFKVPFLSQPLSFYAGEAVYERSFSVDRPGVYYLFIEISKWRLTAFVDGRCIGADESLCAPFLFGPFSLEAGEHSISVSVDNSYIHPYRPDAHGISDCENANWNGMAGRMEILSEDEVKGLEKEKRDYAKAHPVEVHTEGNNVVVNGKAVYLRGTHFAGGFYKTLYPAVDRAYWDRILGIIKDYGFNFIRFHSFCPPDVAFTAADEAGVFLQVECGMWNVFNPGNEEGFNVLLKETEKILKSFGHHPSFIMLSPTNEPGGLWYGPLREWVTRAKELNRELGFEGRRLFTAQSGWFYDTEPSKTTGTDYLYFHRSAFGPIHGGMIRNSWGWGGRDYTPSVEGAKLPVITHELGQWCSYPDFDVIKKFTGPVRGGNYEIFRDYAEKKGALQFNKDFVLCSGKKQVSLLKEEFEANFRTPEITGFEYLDIHDYTGQGTAVVGILDPFFDSKGYVAPEEFRKFNSDTVILPRITKYVWSSSETLTAPVEICNYSGEDLENAVLEWKVTKGTDLEASADEKNGTGLFGKIEAKHIPQGKNTVIGTLEVSFTSITESQKLSLTAKLYTKTGKEISSNGWVLTVFVKQKEPEKSGYHLVRTAEEALKLLDAGEKVLFMPYLSDLDTDCPNLSFKNVYWNAQMGPGWTRQLGMVADTSSPLFRYFPTEKAGGWEWAKIFERARSLNLPPKYPSIVRVIDDWNRNFPLSFIFEGKVLKGKLLFCAADLDLPFEECPEAFSLKQALCSYIASDDFAPSNEIDILDLTRHLRPLYKGTDIINNITVSGQVPEGAEHLTDPNPNRPFRYATESLPVTFTIRLNKKVRVKGLYVQPIQNDRDFPGVIREYSLRAGDVTVSGEWKNCFETQYAPLEADTDLLELTVLSTYNMGTAARWIEKEDGYHRILREEPLQITCASLGIDYEDEDGAEAFNFRRGDEPFWYGEAPKRFKEIDT